MPDQMDEQELTLKLPVYAWAALRGAAKETIRRNSRRSERNRKPLTGIDLNADRSDTLGFAVEQINEVLNEAGLHKKGIRGVISAFDLEKGFGFVQSGEGEAFFHVTAFLGTIEERELLLSGAVVIYDEVPGRAGSGRPAAINIRLSKSDD